jgi:DNA-binding LacI/PurR family transcriptional regulator
MSETARVTLRDIAAKLGVSHVTVSLALKNHPRISVQRREEVRRLAEEMGYAPDPMLSSLIVYRQGKRPAEIHSALAWVNHWENPSGLRKVREFDGYWQGAAEAAQRFGYRLDEFIWEPKMSAKRFETILLTRNVRGILVPPHERQPDWGDFDWSRFSTVRFGLSSKTPDSHIVTSDQMRGVMIAMEKIHSYGYQRIGFVMNAALDRKVGGNYIAGYYAAERQLALSPALPPLGLPEDYAESRELVREWLARHKPDAILTNSGSVPRILEDLRVRVPEDVALAGTTIYDLPISAGLNQHPEEIGRVAVELLVSMINVYDRGTPRVPRRVLIDSEWVDGPSLPPKNTETPVRSGKSSGRAKAR